MTSRDTYDIEVYDKEQQYVVSQSVLQIVEAMKKITEWHAKLQVEFEKTLVD